MFLDENVYPVSIEENGKTYVVENEAGKGFLNEAQKGSLKIVKTSSDGKVEGFSFRVIGNNGYEMCIREREGSEGKSKICSHLQTQRRISGFSHVFIF